jgi:acyl-coenzyme A thioesterase PaaI-like protein
MVSSLQERYAPNGVCFGCGPKNSHGLRLKSVTMGDTVTASWKPKKEHAAFANYGSGGVISVLMDCNGNWAATVGLMKDRHLPAPPGTVTSEISVKFLKPSPVDERWELSAWATRIEGDRVTTKGELKVGGVVTATSTGVYVAVKPSHPAFDRWH